MATRTIPALLSLTPAAVTKIAELFKSDPESQGKCLRIALEPGGCSGMQYAFAFDEKKPGDEEVRSEGFSVVVDAQSAPYLRNSVVDYSEDAAAAGFKIGNPNVKKSCGCGQSNQF